MAERPVRGVPVALLALLLLGHQGYFAVRVLLSDPLYFAAQRELVFWGQEEFRPEPERIAAVSSWMETALGYLPDQPDYLALQARLHIWKGLVAPERSAANAQFLRAISSMEAALANRPGNPYSWAQYAEYLATQPLRAPDMQAAIGRVMLLAPGDTALQQRMQALGVR